MKKPVAIVGCILIILAVAFSLPKVHGEIGGGEGTGGGGGGASGGSAGDVFVPWNIPTDTYMFDLVYSNGSELDHLACAIVGVYANSTQYSKSIHTRNCEEYSLGSAGNGSSIQNIAKFLAGGGTVGKLDKEISAHIEEYAKQYLKDLEIPESTNIFTHDNSDFGEKGGNNAGYRILVQYVQGFVLGQTLNNIFAPIKEARYVFNGNPKINQAIGQGFVARANLYTTRKDVGIEVGKSMEEEENLDLEQENRISDPMNGTGYQIIWLNVQPPYNYSVDAACENCNNTLAEDKGSYYIQDTTNWEAIKKSVTNNTKNVKEYYTKRGYSNVVCREEYKVTFPNANKNIFVQNGQYFTAGMIAPQVGHPNFSPIKVKRIMQCQDIKGGKTNSLKSFANTTLKSAGTISLNYIEGSTVDKLLTKNSKGVYNIKSGDYAGDDYSYKTASIKESKTSTSKTTWNGNMAIIELESNYLLPDELYQYIKKNGKSEVKKPTSNLENYINVGVPNLPISFEEKVKNWDDIAAAVKLSYELPKDNSKMHEAWNSGNKKYFGDANTSNKQNIYVKEEVKNERKEDTACAKLYGYNTAGYKTCASKRKDDKMDDCKSVNKNDYVCPIKSYKKIKDCKKIEKNNCKLILDDGSEAAVPCTSVNSGACVYNVSCQKLNEKTCRITEEGKSRDVECKAAENLFPNGCPYETQPNRCQTLDDFKTCELQEFKNGEWRYINGSRKDCSVYAKKYKVCPQGGGGSIEDLIYRPIDLNVPFPGMSGIGRESGNNWCDSEGKCKTGTSYTINTNVTNNRGTTTDQVYSETPMYSFVLDGNKIKQIKKYNNSHDYSDFTLKCEKDGTACTSSFIKNYSPTGLCAGSSGKNNFYKCKYGLAGK